MDTVHKIGRRKTAVARIYLSEGKGNITVNKKDFKDYFPTGTLQYKVQQPLMLTENLTSYDVKVNVFGVQADADLSENVSAETQYQLKDFLELEERTMSVRSAPVFSFPFYLILIFMSLLAVATLLTFKKLKTQQRLGRLNFVFNLLATVFVVISFYIAKNQSATIIEDVVVTANLVFGFYCFIIATAFAFLAIIRIKRVLKLIESVDRIR